MIVQIYGITTPEDAAGVASLQPDFAGLVLDEGIDTWDSVDDATARAIVHELRGHVRVVALSLATDFDRIRRAVDQLEPDVVHLARPADAMTPEAIAMLRDELDPVEVMTTIPVRSAEAIAIARAFAPASDSLLLDTAHPHTGVVGASGYTHDWSHSAAVVASVDAPVILAGGLGPDNVADAIAQVRPWGVDSETRTSRPDDRRRKDLDAVRWFIERARATVSAG